MIKTKHFQAQTFKLGMPGSLSIPGNHFSVLEIDTTEDKSGLVFLSVFRRTNELAFAQRRSSVSLAWVGIKLLLPVTRPVRFGAQSQTQSDYVAFSGQSHNL